MKFNRNLIGLSFLIFVGCANLEGLNLNKNNLGQERQKEKNIELVQEDIYLGDNGVDQVLKDIRSNWKENIQREVTLNKSKNNYELYVGETLKINSPGIANIKLQNKENENSSKAELYSRGGIYYFRSIYQGNYKLKIDYLDGSFKIINIFNKMKFKFSENESYRIINDEYNNGKYEQALKNLDLYKLSFSNGNRNKDISILNIKVLFETRNYEETRKGIKELKLMSGLTQKNLVEMFEIEDKINFSKNPVDRFYYNYTDNFMVLADTIKNNLLSKENLSSEEYLFLESMYRKTNDLRIGEFLKNKINLTENNFIKPIFEDSELSTSIENKNEIEESKFFNLGKNSYEKNRYNEAILYLNKILSSNSNPDKYYYLSDSYYRIGNYEKAIENYKLYLNLGDEGIKKAEASYNLGLAYEKLGKNLEALESFKDTIKKFPGTSWARKSNIYIIRLKSN